MQESAIVQKSSWLNQAKTQMSCFFLSPLETKLGLEKTVEEEREAVDWIKATLVQWIGYRYLCGCFTMASQQTLPSSVRSTANL